MALEMAHSSEHDFLTGLPNRMLLNERIDQAIALARRHAKRVAVLFLDLDGFKHINDSLGHPAGDRLLQSIASRLVGCVRSSDTVQPPGRRRICRASFRSRTVGSAGHYRHKNAAGRGGGAFGRPARPPCHRQHRRDRLSGGWPGCGELLKNADTAMYQARESGRRNSFQFFEPAMNVLAVERQSIEEDLRHAIDRREFVLHYQPKIDLETGLITGAEALIRWKHPHRGFVSPAQFIPVAEDCGLILQIGAWVLREACAQARVWQDAGLPAVSIAVNVSAMEFRAEHFLADVFAVLKETGMDPKNLELELTESVLMKHAASAAVILHTLRDSGIWVALDDFGTGYSSLSYLQKFPVDALKIDQSFIREISTSGGGDTSIVTAIINMARGLNLRVIAEGVETEEELDFLRANQCDEVQGYCFSRPVPPEHFAKLLASGIGRDGGRPSGLKTDPRQPAVVV